VESSTDNPPLIVIVGPTASGKSRAALLVAQKFDGEIIAADSRTIYKEMNIGTAKPSAFEQKQVAHHMIDVVDPGTPFTAADFKARAQKCITEVSARGNVPVLVGGTGLYIDAVLFDFQFQKPGDAGLREKLQKLSVEELQQQLQDKKIPLPENSRNPRHLIRRLETGGEDAQPYMLRPNTLVIGMIVDREVLRKRIATRVAGMFSSGLESEVRMLADTYGWAHKSLQTIGYQEFKPYFEGTQTLADTQAAIIQNTISYAKRQRTWFARNKSIHWCTEQVQIEDLITTFLSK
jgi:tRNA dimethylallyltransferase